MKDTPQRDFPFCFLSASWIGAPKAFPTEYSYNTFHKNRLDHYVAFAIQLCIMKKLQARRRLPNPPRKSLPVGKPKKQSDHALTRIAPREVGPRNERHDDGG